MLSQKVLKDAIIFNRSLYDENQKLILGDELGKKSKIANEFEFYDGEFIFLNFFRAHHGHFITEELGRLWWVLKNGAKNYKFVYNRWQSPQFSAFERFVLELFKLDESKLIAINKPSKFKELILPDNSFHCEKGTEWHRKTIDFITSQVKPIKNEALYLSRRKFNKAKSLEFGEEYFEAHYAKKGYKIIYPETLSPQEQLGLWGGGDEICCDRRNFAS